MKIDLGNSLFKVFDIDRFYVFAKVRYWEDAQINGLEDTENGDKVPCKNSELWTPIIEVDTGKIINWVNGVKADIHYKVCDEFSCKIVNPNGEVLLSVEDAYVPECLCPKESGYGDYIIMDIDEKGYIQNWKFGISDLKELMIKILGE